MGNPRTPRDLLLHSTTRVRVADADADAATGAIGAPDSESAIPAEIVIPAGLSISALRARLGALPAKLLRVDDVLRAFGAFDQTAEGARELTSYHEDLQELLSSWCCTADERFKRTAGVIPYVLPPLEGQSVWRAGRWTLWAAKAMADIFDAAGDAARAKAIRP